MTEEPWQLKLFKKSIKKNIKVDMLKKHLRDLSGKRCLMITNGDNSGAMNYHLRACGGQWTWADMSPQNLAEMEEFLGEKVLHLAVDRFDLPDEYFDRVVVIDVHEHLPETGGFNEEVLRVTKKGGRIIVTTPSHAEGRLVTRIRDSLGMTKEIYGHVREGYDVKQLKEMLDGGRAKVYAAGDYSKFFTEIIELAINFTYVKLLDRRGSGSISPARKDQLMGVKGSYRAYSILYPVLRLVSRLDGLLGFERGYAAIVEFQRI